MTSRVEEFLASAAAQPVELSVSALLAVWGFRFRTPDTTGRILRDLADAGLHCEPDFGVGGLDVLVRVSGLSTDSPTGHSPGGAATEPETQAAEDDPEEDEPLRLSHLFPLIGEIPSATGGFCSVRPSDTLQDAQSLMVEKDYSQLAVITGPYELVGAVSWRSIAEARLGKRNITMADVIDHHPKVVSTTATLFDQIGILDEAGYVFVRDPAGRICGIVTTADLSIRFRDLTAPFFQLGEIEYSLRECIKQKGITLDEIKQVTRKGIRSVDSMTFGNYYYLLADPAIWQKMGWEISQERFLRFLKSAWGTRNKVAHYDARPVSPDEMKDLRLCLNYMRRLNPTTWA
jgi:hypothetical protein